MLRMEIASFSQINDFLDCLCTVWASSNTRKDQTRSRINFLFEANDSFDVGKMKIFWCSLLALGFAEFNSTWHLKTCPDHTWCVIVTATLWWPIIYLWRSLKFQLQYLHCAIYNKLEPNKHNLEWKPNQRLQLHVVILIENWKTRKEFLIDFEFLTDWIRRNQSACEIWLIQ